LKTKANLFITGICIAILMSCHANKDVIGKYTAEGSDRVQLEIKEGGQFQFINEDVMSFMLKKEPYFYTSGTWSIKGTTLILNSEPGKSENFKSRIELLETAENESTFIIFNYFGDTLAFNFVYKNGDPFLAKFHGNYSIMKDKVQIGDVFKLNLYGYNTFMFKISDDTPKIYHITIAMHERNDHFKNRIFFIRNKKLIVSKENVKFRRSKYN
jgi:hypothetical protein